MRTSLLAVCVAACVLSACAGSAGDDRRGKEVQAVPQSGPSSAKTARLVAPRVAVIDHGSGPALCLGAVQLSSPPGCTGTPLVGWIWPAGSQREAGVRWGTYSVVGSYDGKRFHAEKTIDEAEAARYPSSQSNPDFTTRCAEPKGGWRAPEPARATAEDQERLFTAASKLPGYGNAWIDDRGHNAQNSRDVVVNVQVTGDIEEATRELRRHWGGSLCVSRAMHTEKEILAISDALMKRPDALGCGFSVEFLEYSTAYDDGSLQRELDDEYGKGLVRVSSTLQRYRG